MDAFTNPLDFEQCNISEIETAVPVGPVRPSFAAAAHPTGTSSEGLFSSPFSLASGSTGGGKVGSTLGLVYVGKV
jgi:hypothetical protein